MGRRSAVPTVTAAAERRPFSGSVRRVLWGKPGSGYKILSVQTDGGSSLVVKGDFGDVQPGDHVAGVAREAYSEARGETQLHVRGKPRVRKAVDADPDSLVDVDGAVMDVIFRNDSNGFSVLSIEDSRLGSQTLTGSFPSVSAGSRVRGRASATVGPSGAPQLAAVAISVTVPTDASGLERYLASGVLSGVGPAKAKSLVNAFGATALEAIRAKPDVVAVLSGFNIKLARRMQAQAIELTQVEGIMTWLLGKDLSVGLASRIFREYGDLAIEVLERDPWSLSTEMIGIGFLKADSVAAKMGLGGLNPGRISAAIEYAIRELTSKGDTGAHEPELRRAVGDLLGCPNDDPALLHGIASLLSSGRLHALQRESEHPFIQPRALAEAEASAARRLLAQASSPPPWNVRAARAAIAAAEVAVGKPLSEDQREAVSRVVGASVSILTGGPGRGKTTVTAVILDALEAATPGLRISLASPTGKAASRLSEAAGREATTLHRLLEWGHDGRPQRNTARPLDGDLFVIDEASMLDARMLSHVMDAVPVGAALIFIGDSDQLPSIGAGNVLGDLIASERIAVARLTQPHRQVANSRIILNADLVNAGDAQLLKGGDCDIVSLTRPPSVSAGDWRHSERLADEVLRLATETAISAGFSPNEVQVITAGHNGACGTVALNQELRLRWNAVDSPELVSGAKRFKAGDRVLITKNDKVLNIFNGMSGWVDSVNQHEGSLLCTIDGAKVEIPKGYLAHVDLGYAMTCHKMQGSQAPCVIVVVDWAQTILHTRSWLYTAMTRAARHLILVGRPKAIRTAISRRDSVARMTMLRHHLVAS